MPIRKDAEAWLRITLAAGVSPAAQRRLLREFGLPEQVLASRAPELATGPDAALLERTLRWLDEPRHHLLTLADAEYPQALLEAGAAPTVLYAVGRVEFLNAPSFAIVGSRNATPQGMRDAESFAQDLSAAGLTIVSGMALGIDAAAHRGGLVQRGSTVAVLGTGADRVYPRDHKALAHEIAERGCLASEFPLGTPPTPGNFPQRNRLISGLSRGVLVVEAADRSGSLITARYAGEQGRDVFAMPGSIHSPLAKGCHRLIGEGAKLVESANDVLVELGFAARGERVRAAAGGNGADRGEIAKFLRAMGHGPVTVDEMVLATRRDASEVSTQLARLELEGRVETLAGGRFQRTAPGRVIE